MIARTGPIAVVAAIFSTPSLALADPADPFADDAPAAEAGDDVPAPAADAADAADATDESGTGSGDAPGVLYPELAADAPQPQWAAEGGAATGPAEDPRALNRKIRRAGVITLAGGGIAVIGGAIAIAGALMLYVGNPSRRLNDLADDNNGALPVDDPKRHQAISLAYATPIVIYSGLGVLGAGVITAGVARFRLKKLRDRKKNSAVALAPASLGHGAMLRWEVRF